MTKKILITAGGTKENIDPVRYIGNYSSGKMGIAIADEAFSQGYEVTLISTVEVKKDYSVILAKCADDMLKTVLQYFSDCDCLIMAAAVADYKPASTAPQKIKKTGQESIILELVKTPDILKEVSKLKKEKQVVIGFCAESENLLNNAQKKLEEKKLDYIVANDISRNDIGFGNDYNEVTVISKDGSQIYIERTTKQAVAKRILELV